jgi:hypothetical protein
LRKYCWTAKLIGLESNKPPKILSYSPKLAIWVGVSTGPFSARPTNAVVDVETPVIVRTPLGISSM